MSAFRPIVRLLVCPVCGRAITQNYTLDLTGRRKTCTKKIHLASGVDREYVLATTARDAVADAMRNGHPDDGSDQDEAVLQDATETLRKVVLAAHADATATTREESA